MSDPQTKLGAVITHADAGRDAVHIAVAPMVAAEKLFAGQHVAITADATKAAVAPGLGAGTAVGIVDPFLTAPVFEGQRFWLFLYPNTITGLRHEWTHPAFAKDASPAPSLTGKAASEAWIAQFASELDKTPNALMRDAHRWVQDSDWTYDNSEAYKDADSDKWPEFWNHYEIVTGETVNDHDATVYTCSC